MNTIVDHDRVQRIVIYQDELVDPHLPTVEQVEEVVEEYLLEDLLDDDDRPIDFEITQVSETGGFPGEYYAEYVLVEQEPDFESIVEARRDARAEAIGYSLDRRW